MQPNKTNVMRSSKMSLKSKFFFFFCFVFWHFLLVYYLGFNLVKTLWRLRNWFSRNSSLSDYKNNKKQKKLFSLFGYIFKVIFASSDSFCLIASQIITHSSTYQIIYIGDRAFSTGAPKLQNSLKADRHQSTSLHYFKIGLIKHFFFI